MLKNGLVIILSSIFLLIIAMPSIIIVLDDSADISIFYNTSEEEKDKSQEKNVDKEFVAFQIKAVLKTKVKNVKAFSLYYYLKSYKKPHIELFFPPPKLVSVLSNI